MAAAVNEDAWDIGIAGVVPNIIGGSQGLTGIGICFDQSAINQLVATKEGVAMWDNLASQETITVASSPKSTGDYVVQACLKAEGYDLSKVNFIDAQQKQIIESNTQ